MTLRVLKIPFGLASIALGSFGVWQIASQNIFADIRRWYVGGGTQVITWLGREHEISARLLATLVTLLPIAFIAFGFWLCYSAFRRRRRAVAPP